MISIRKVKNTGNLGYTIMGYLFIEHSITLDTNGNKRTRIEVYRVTGSETVAQIAEFTMQTQAIEQATSEYGVDKFLGWLADEAEKVFEVDKWK